MKKIGFKDYLIDYLEFYKITNKDFANRIGITPKHLINILAGNVRLSGDIINKISIVTDIPIDYIYKIELNYYFELEIEKYLEKNNLTLTQYLNRFNYKYLVENKYIDFVDVEDKTEVIKDILKFLRVPSPEKVLEVDKCVLYKSKNDKPELLLLWLEKCYKEAMKQSVGEYNKENIDVLVQYISKCAKINKFNANELREIFNKNGIYLVIQDDIPGSKIRGAFRVHRGVPAIYLTRKYKRIADIYFALLHELAHCKTDFNKAQAESLVSYDADKCEERADKQAFDWMINDDYYNYVCLLDDYSIEREKNYPKAFIVYRMAKDGRINYNSKIYQDCNVLI